jgi:hypothetical protein
MALNISRGKKARPQKLVIYAPAGIGKSTLASQLPSPLFIDFEGGTHQLDVSRLEPSTLAEFEKIVRELCKDPQGFQTVVIDTIDWLEESAVRQVVTDAENDNVKTIEDFGFGKGWLVLNNKMNAVTALFDRLIDAGLHVVCLAHAAVRKFEDPKQACSYDRYELKMYKDRPGAKGSAALVKEWADALLFGSYEDRVKAGAQEGQKGKAVASSGRERSLYCCHTAAWDAKNRHGLRDKESWSVETLMKVLGNPAPAGKPAVAVKAPAPVQPTPEAAAMKAKAIAAQTESESGGPPVTKEESGGLPVGGEQESGGDPITGESGGDPVTGEESPGDAVVFVTPLPTSDDPIEGIEEHEEPDEELDRMLSPHAAQVNLFLRDKEKVGPYQSYRSMPAAYRTQVLSNPSGFLARVKAYSAERSAA